jgi:hypothetical protein
MRLFKNDEVIQDLISAYRPNARRISTFRTLAPSGFRRRNHPRQTPIPARSTRRNLAPSIQAAFIETADSCTVDTCAFQCWAHTGQMCARAAFVLRPQPLNSPYRPERAILYGAKFRE